MAFVLRPAGQIPPDVDPSLSYTHCPEGLEIIETNNSSILTTTTTPAPFTCWCEGCETSNIKEPLANVSTAQNTSAAEGEEDHCYLLRFDTDLDKMRRIADLAMMVGAFLYLLDAFKESKRLGLVLFFETWASVPGRVMFIFSCFLILLSLPFRLTCQPRTEDRIIVVAMFLTPMHFLYFCRGFKSVGPFVVMIYKMIVSDLLCFVLIYMIFVFGFAEGELFNVNFIVYH